MQLNIIKFWPKLFIYKPNYHKSLCSPFWFSSSLLLHTFSIGQIWNSDRPVKHALCIQSHAVVTYAEWVSLLKWSSGKKNVSPKFQHKPQWYLHIYADHPCNGHWCAPIQSKRLVFTLFIGNSLAGPCAFYLWHVESDAHFSQKQALTREHVSTVFRSISDDFSAQKLGSFSADSFSFHYAISSCISWTDNYLTKFGTKWWTTTHPCSQILWWMIPL